MHIAHPQNAQFISVEELAKTLGLRRRQIAELARDRKIPGAIRLDGYHYAYPVTPDLLDWIEWKRHKVNQRKRAIEQARPKPTSGLITIQGIRQSFDVWKRRVGGLNGILKMDRECQQDILVELQAFARLHQDIYRALNLSQH